MATAAAGAAASTASGVPEEVETLFQKHKRMKFFIAQYEQEWELLEKVKHASAELCTHKESAKHLSLFGPGQPSELFPIG